MAKKQKHGEALENYLAKLERQTEQKPGESLMQYYRRLAKAADQRLVRLEGYAHEEHYKNILEWSYAKAQDAIKHWSGEGAMRFNTAPPDTPRELKSKIEDIKQFLQSATSTKQGITEVYKKRADAFNEKFDTDFTWQDIANFYERKLNDKFNMDYGSETKFKAIGAIKAADPFEIKKAMEEARVNHLKISDDDEVNAKAREFLSQYGKEVMDLFPEIKSAKEPRE